ncbi:MAG: class I mannose-6-phosphate isomerase [Bacteroidales bacterium]|nr:class I mannose-6-phosphate isomerase [Bacteroidales bacterium]
MNNKLYPLKFDSILKDKIWGGNRLSMVLNKSLSSDKVGESWEISGYNGDISVVKNGFLAGNNLLELIEIYMSDLVGEKVYNKFGIEFPLLIKFIEAADDLSIQVHPNDTLAKERHQSNGKTEMWYIIEAEKGSQIPVGFNKKLDKETYIKHVNEKTLIDILNVEKTASGDVFFLPAGRVHAIGKGILLAEIQQTSDLTYRIYDYDRRDANGNLRELHTDLALDAIDFNVYDEYKTKYSSVLNTTSNIVKCQYFSTNILEFDQAIKKDYNLIDSFVIYMCLEGEFEIRYNGSVEKLTKGETVLIPADIAILSLVPQKKSKILEVYIPD